MFEEKAKERKVAIELRTSESNLPYLSDTSELPIHLMADRMIIRYIPPSDKIEDTTLDLHRAPSIEKTSVKGVIAAYGDSSDLERPIPTVLRQLGLVVKYSKNYAEEFTWKNQAGETHTYHMIRWNEIQYIL